MLRRAIVYLAAAGLMLLVGRRAIAAPPDVLTVQGVLREDAGGLQDGLFNFRVRLLDGSTAFYDETFTDVPVMSGVFQFELRVSTGTLADLMRAHPAALMEVSVNGSPVTTEPLYSTPYALYAAHCDSATSANYLGALPPQSWTTKAELVDGDPATAPVSWDDLNGFPQVCASPLFLAGFDGSGLPVCRPAAVASLSGGGGIIVGGTSDLALSIDPNVIQTRVTTDCGPGFAIRSIQENGEAVCESAGTGGGALGPNTVVTSHIVDGEVSAADIGTSAVGSDELAIGAVTPAHLAIGSCAEGDTLMLGAAGWDCSAPQLSVSIGQGLRLVGDTLEALPTVLPSNVSTSHAESIVEDRVAVAIGADGCPVIAFRRTAEGFLRMARCSDPQCSSLVERVVDGTGDVGAYPSVYVQRNGNPAFAYYDVDNGDLKYAQCNDRDCTTATLSVLDNAGDVGQHTSVARGSADAPIIAYYDATNGDLKVAICLDDACASPSIKTIASSGDVGKDNSIAVDLTGSPIISFYDATGGDLKHARCFPASCNSPYVVTVDSTGDVGRGTSISVGNDGWTWISYLDVTNGKVKLAHCLGGNACVGATKVTLTGLQASGLTAISVGQDGLPTVVYRETEANSEGIAVARCADAACSTTAAGITVLLAPGPTSYAAAALGHDGNLFVSYSLGQQGLHTEKCANVFCARGWSRR
ncbi:MAG: hypothetical protein AB2A00_00715 [Myxococcota bacterium]